MDGAGEKAWGGGEVEIEKRCRWGKPKYWGAGTIGGPGRCLWALDKPAANRHAFCCDAELMMPSNLQAPATSQLAKALLVLRGGDYSRSCAADSTDAMVWRRASPEEEMRM
jgi:hypothetical protein